MSVRIASATSASAPADGCGVRRSGSGAFEPSSARIRSCSPISSRISTTRRRALVAASPPGSNGSSGKQRRADHRADVGRRRQQVVHELVEAVRVARVVVVHHDPHARARRVAERRVDRLVAVTAQPGSRIDEPRSEDDCWCAWPMIAEGGTERGHAVSIARGHGPDAFEGCPSDTRSRARAARRARCRSRAARDAPGGRTLATRVDTRRRRPARRVGSLSLEQKVRLLTGADFWSLHAEPAVGLRRLVVSDGPAGVRGETWDERDTLGQRAVADGARRDLGRGAGRAPRRAARRRVAAQGRRRAARADRQPAPHAVRRAALRVLQRGPAADRADRRRLRARRAGAAASARRSSTSSPTTPRRSG